MSCFIRGCKTDYLSDRKKNKENNQKNLSFFYAHNDEMLRDWQNAIPLENNKLIRKKDRVCELHFKETDIKSEYVTQLSNGDVCRIPKGRVTLKIGAVPCIFPKEMGIKKHKMSTISSEIGVHAADHFIPEKKMCDIPISKILREQHSIQICDEISVTNSVSVNKNACNFENSNSSGHPPLEGVITDTNDRQENTSSESGHNQLDIISNDIQRDVSNESLFDTIVKNLAFIPLPFDVWVAGSAYGNVMWTLWRKDLSAAEYHVVLYPDMSLQIHIEGRIVSVPGMETLASMHGVREMLQKVTTLLPCKTIDSKKRGEECAGYVLRKNLNQRGPQRQTCNACRKLQKNILKRSKKVGTLERQQNKLLNIRGRYANIRRRNQRLKNKVGRCH